MSGGAPVNPGDKVLQTIIKLAPITAELAERAVALCKEAEAEDLDDLLRISPYEMFGVLIDKAHTFIRGAGEGDEAILDSLKALKDLNLEVTLFLYQIRKEVLNGQEEENDRETDQETVAKTEDGGQSSNEGSG